jgi:hypothetical protein
VKRRRQVITMLRNALPHCACGWADSVACLLVMSTVVAALGKFWGWLGHQAYLLEALTLAFPEIITNFCTIYKVLPSTPVAWRTRWAGACSPPCSSPASPIGLQIEEAQSRQLSHGSPVLLLLWIHYSAQIFSGRNSPSLCAVLRLRSRVPR